MIVERETRNLQNADKSSLWETRQFLNHYHPSVNVYAEALINGTEQVKPDLGLFTLTHFLDRFVYKNAKQKVNAKGSSIMQPLGGSHTGSLIVRATNLKSTELPVNTEAWLSKKLEDVQADEKFFHLYFKSKKNKVVSETSHKETANEDDEGLDDDEEWKALVKSKPDVEASDDDGFSDFDEEDFSDLSEAEEGAEIDEELLASDDDVEIPLEALEEEGEGQEDEVEDDSEEAKADIKLIDDEAEELDDGMFGMNSDEYDSDAFAEEASKKRANDDDDEGSKKKKIKKLPIFADAGDYAKYLDSEDEDYS